MVWLIPYLIMDGHGPASAEGALSEVRAYQRREAAAALAWAAYRTGWR
jgi:hypothetical protein